MNQPGTKTQGTVSTPASGTDEKDKTETKKKGKKTKKGNGE